MEKTCFFWEDPEATALQKTMAQHYLHRFGSDDTRSNSTRAGVYLLAAAELGDSNAQQMRLVWEVEGKCIIGGWEGTV